MAAVEKAMLDDIKLFGRSALIWSLPPPLPRPLITGCHSSFLSCFLSLPDLVVVMAKEKSIIDYSEG